MPEISVIIPTYNRGSLVGRAIKSVLKQVYRDIELIVVDDGSLDDTGDVVAVLKDQSRDIRVTYKKTENRGVAAARNTGIGLAGGSWLAFLDSDDLWMPDKLAKQRLFLSENPGIRLVHSDERWIRNGVRVNKPKAYRKFGGEVFIESLAVCMIGPSTVMMEKSLLDQVGGFDEAFPVCEDYDLWLRITSRWKVGLIEEELTWKFGGHDDQLSTTHVAMDYWRIRSLCKLLQSVELPAHFEGAAKKTLVEKAKILLNGYRKHGRLDLYDSVSGEIMKVLPDFQTP